MEAPVYSRLAAFGVANGYSVSAAAIHRWVRQRLLPPTATKHSRGRRGFVSKPNAGVEAQLLALLEWRKLTKSTDALRVLLWMDGWTIPTTDVLAAVGRSMPSRLRLTESLREEVSRIARKSAVTVRRRVGAHGMDPESAAEGLEFLVLRALGDRSDAGGTVAESLHQLLGLDRAQSDAVGDTPPWLPPTSPSEAPQILDDARISEFPESVSAATTRDLERNRARVAFLVSVLWAAAEVIELYGGPNFAGMRGLRLHGPGHAPFAVALALHIDRIGLGERLDTLIEATEASGIRDAIAALAEVREAVASHPQRALIRRRGLRALSDSAAIGTEAAAHPRPGNPSAFSTGPMIELEPSEQDGLVAEFDQLDAKARQKSKRTSGLTTVHVPPTRPNTP